MQKLPAPKRPAYAIASVDNAIRLVHMLRDRGEVRLKTAAIELGVAESTVHRLMSMLVFHGLAVQDDRRVYVPGPTVGAVPVRMPGTELLRTAAATPLEELSQLTGETVNLQIRVGTKLRFLDSFEGDKMLRIVARPGAVVPAATAAGGRVLLAHIPEDRVRTMYQSPMVQAQGDGLSDRQLDRLISQLRVYRQQGYAVSNGETESGVAAVAVAIHNPAGRVIAALAIAAPSVRYAELVQDDVLTELRAARDDIQANLADITPTTTEGVD
ncbi:IclR family transcriptional regulator [Georgenia sp. SYP-B2076]|uniref:IclR family transcriptional regulator n=1 Tax=Georgenia sp. SYP-B2076 TaxID=2495881 RepID=UPI000F8F4807|nr:IclR family transcriptional regulator [Georgenia sp. SYP-B2076]